MDICIALAFSASILLRLPGPVTLSWYHSVEHFRLEEDYRATAGGTLVLSEVRTAGLGAGVDLPPDAERVGGHWRFRPKLPPQPQVRLANSGFVPGYSVCWAGQCRHLDELAGVARQPLELRAC